MEFGCVMPFSWSLVYKGVVGFHFPMQKSANITPEVEVREREISRMWNLVLLLGRLGQRFYPVQ